LRARPNEALLRRAGRIVFDPERASGRRHLCRDVDCGFRALVADHHRFLELDPVLVHLDAGREVDREARICEMLVPGLARAIVDATTATTAVKRINRVPDVRFFPRSSEERGDGVWGKVKKVVNYVRRGWSSTNPDSYSHYRRGRERQRKQEERGREEADRSAELGREEVRRGREYEERYAAERAAEEPHTQTPRDDPGKPE
jgi:hypothetical protein